MVWSGWVLSWLERVRRAGLVSLGRVLCSSS